MIRVALEAMHACCEAARARLTGALCCPVQDYARLHNYNVLTPCNLADPTLTNMWNKIGWLLKAMRVRDRPGFATAF